MKLENELPIKKLNLKRETLRVARKGIQTGVRAGLPAQPGENSYRDNSL